VNDPNDWEEGSDGNYAINLSRRLITMTIKTMEIVDNLPKESFQVS